MGLKEPRSLAHRCGGDQSHVLYVLARFQQHIDSSASAFVDSDLVFTGL